jgi:hypothetical protein
MKVSKPNQHLTPSIADETLVPENLEEATKLLNELNLLKLEGHLFCFDPKEAARREGTRTVNQVERFTDIVNRPVVVSIDAQYGQPSVLAYKVLQAVFRKITEEGWPIPDTASFSQRELLQLVGRSSWGGNSGRQLYRAVMQLHRTSIRCSWFDKESGEWTIAHFNPIAAALFSGKKENIKESVITINQVITKSLNSRHWACFNWTRMQDLEPISAALYKRLSFHFSNLLSNLPKPERERLLYAPGTGAPLVFTKSYEDICREWLGGLQPLRYRSDIMRDQLGRHFEALKRTKVVQSIEIAEMAGGGWKIVFRAGRAFFADYDVFYVKKWQPQLRLRQTSDRRQIEQPLALVAYFHQKQGSDQNSFLTKETAYASSLLDRYSFEELRDLIDFSYAQAQKTKFAMQTFNAIKQYVDQWQGEAARVAKVRMQIEKVKACLSCDDRGMLHVRDARGTISVIKCPHDAAKIQADVRKRGFRPAA